MKNRIRVMVVEDSAVVRELLCHIIGGDGRFEIVAAVDSAEDALACLEEVAPDVITLDIRLPGMNGLEATLQIMARRPTPIVVVSANVESDELNIAMNALRAGALTVVEKPVGVTDQDYEIIADDLRNQLAIMSQVKVLRQVRRRNLSFGSAEAGETGVAGPPPTPLVRPHMLGVVASTGGPNALSVMLAGLGRDFPLPVLVVQHITPSFNEGFATWLGEIVPLPVVVVQDGDEPRPGQVHLPPADRHLVYRNGQLRLDRGAPVSNQRPSGTALFASLAADLGSRAMGILLTGMGSDGADGLLAMRKAGAFTIAEDKSTAVIFGMPEAAIRLGAAAEALPLPMIAPRVLEILGDTR